MRVRKHFRTSIATIDYIISDFSYNRISDRDVYFKYSVNKRMHKLNEKYDEKLDKALSNIITHYSYDDMPIKLLSKLIMSLSHVTNVLSKGLISIISN